MPDRRDNVAATSRAKQHLVILFAHNAHGGVMIALFFFLLLIPSSSWAWTVT
jgi:hypothetical protein